MRSWLYRNRLWLFFALAFPLSWYPWLIALARGSSTGPNPLGPFVAALIVTAIAYRWAGVKELLKRIVRWRVGVSSWLVAIGLPIVICAISAAIAGGVATDPLKITPVRWQDVVERFLFIFLFIGLGEEPGWRGYALPELQQRHSPFKATVILAAIWAVWHLPLMGTEFKPAIIPAFLIGLFGTSFVQTWLFNRSNGSVLLQMVLHATVNTLGAGLVFAWFSPRDVEMLWWINGALWLAAGLTAFFAVPVPHMVRRSET